ncbi:putative phenylacetic acid degradation protein PaaC/phenylacetate-CoA oxygenase, PaaI subunit [Nocardioides flavus (ex Wang et al. 2016)]|uniref:Phenylacetic acid degradation protein PaaC/phenylacetate-CoA oxygenase, PaaI subunit n=1 Tax=Nocardioides flavus (ex Wang et al. 2016) TaxID=2058780 RepID=A0ABQ3HJ67_9ACTN|nr:1,2-phenylacetyl-CoA epoxidase subunit PaaC [Nocardioides flavus (ex Wang et al. 2016)]GHE17690.1 putative phenylacetic acid degradation protein PaaC/phenylacetate-CoA oxygenase, PaaI subunit [Nocardioides flavus (ex Wang et al. 2016)]
MHTTPEDEHDSAYSGLLVNDAHWAFGAAPVPDGHGEDPLAGVDTTIPDGVDAATLATYALMLGDDALVMSHRLSEWTSNAPDLEDDIALSNISLDLLGQARLLLARAAKADASVVPVLPEGSPVPPEDALAFFREAQDFRNVRLAELVNGDFAEATVRVLLFSTWRLAIFERLRASRDHVLAAVAAKGVKELAYHRDYSARWFVTLAQGTDESRRRLLAALDLLWPLWPELFDTHAFEAAAAAAGVGVDPTSVREAAEGVLEQVLAAADVPRPEAPRRVGVLGRTGRDGMHGEPLGRMLAEMQSVARAHPLGQW